MVTHQSFVGKQLQQREQTLAIAQVLEQVGHLAARLPKVIVNPFRKCLLLNRITFICKEIYGRVKQCLFWEALRQLESCGLIS